MNCKLVALVIVLPNEAQLELLHVQILIKKKRNIFENFIPVDLTTFVFLFFLGLAPAIL